MWDVPTGQLRTTFDDFETPPFQVACSLRADSFASANGDASCGSIETGTSRVWRVSTAEVVEDTLAANRGNSARARGAQQDFGGFLELTRPLVGGELLPPAASFQAIASYAQSGDRIEGESASPGLLHHVTGTIEGGV